MTKKKSLLEIETENEISTFLALIICKVSSFKLCGPIISTSSTYYVVSVYKIHVMFPH